MNKHGQTLLLFVILIPIILILLGVIVDTGYVMGKKVHFMEVTKQVIKDNIYADENKIKDNLQKNEIPIDYLKIIKTDGKLEIQNKLEVKSIFGSLVGIKKYTIRIHISGSLEKGKVVLES